MKWCNTDSDAQSACARLKHGVPAHCTSGVNTGLLTTIYHSSKQGAKKQNRAESCPFIILEAFVKPGTQLKQIAVLMTVFRDVPSQTIDDKEEGAVMRMLLIPHRRLSSVFPTTQSVLCCHLVFTRRTSKSMMVESSSNRLFACIENKGNASERHFNPIRKDKVHTHKLPLWCFPPARQSLFDF